MPDRIGIFWGWSVNLSNFWGLGVEAGASPMYQQKMRVPPPPGEKPFWQEILKGVEVSVYINVSF